MRRFLTKKIATVGLAAGIVVGVASAAFAYFTSNGSGTGSATTGTSSSVTIAQDAFGGGNPAVALTPGGGGQALGFTITNPSTGYEYVHTVTLSIATDSTGTQCTAPNTPSGCNANYGDVEATPGSTGSDVAGCLASWYSLTQPGTVNQDIPGTHAGGNTYDDSYSLSSASLALSDSGTNQNACESATVGLNYSSN